MKTKLRNAPDLFLAHIRTFFLLSVLILFGFNLSTAQNDNANENATVDGGYLTTSDGATEVTICLDGEPDPIYVNLEGASGRVKQWIITDDNDKILALPEAPPFDLDGAPPGVCRIYHLSYNGIKPLVDPFWHKHIEYLNDLRGKFDLSNYIEVTRIPQPEAGSIALVDGGTELEICAGDGESDAFDVIVSGAEGGTSQWVITDDSNNILALPDAPPFDLEGAPEGTCLVWYLRYEWIDGLEIDLNTDNLTGCFDLSNTITVVRNGVGAGNIYLDDMSTEITICSGDGVSDAFNINTSGAAPGPTRWIITNDAGNILALPDHGPPFDLEGVFEGVCLIWYLSYEEGLEGVATGSNVNTDLVGCYDLSNPITVVRNEVNAGDIYLDDMSTEITICAGDGVSDAFNINTSGAAPGPTAWVITNADADILALPDHGPPFDLEGAGDGTCLIWYLSYEEGLEGAEVGNNANTDLSGCYDLSNPITVVRNGVIGGTLEGGPFNFTVGDDTADNIPEGAITLLGNEGANSQWVVTNADGTIILGLPDNYWDVNFDGAGAGTCLVWHLSYEDGLTGLEVAGEGEDPKLVADLDGCYSLSNSVEVVRTAASGRIAIYPNPTKGSVNIDVSRISSDNLSVEVYSLQNLRLYSGIINSNVLRRGTTTLNVNRFDDGIYIVKVIDNTSGETYLKRFVVKK